MEAVANHPGALRQLPPYAAESKVSADLAPCRDRDARALGSTAMPFFCVNPACTVLAQPKTRVGGQWCRACDATHAPGTAMGSAAWTRRQAMPHAAWTRRQAWAQAWVWVARQSVDGA